jgi:hypothetical protein
MGITHKQSFNKRYKQPLNQSNSIKQIAKLSGFSIKTLQEVYNRGYGAYFTNPSSVRPNVKTPEQWALARIYAFVNKIESGKKLNQDTDLLK